MTKRAAQTHKIIFKFSDGRVVEYTASSEAKAHTAGRAHVAKAKRYGWASSYAVEEIGQ